MTRSAGPGWLTQSTPERTKSLKPAVVRGTWFVSRRTGLSATYVSYGPRTTDHGLRARLTDQEIHAEVCSPLHRLTTVRVRIATGTEVRGRQSIQKSVEFCVVRPA